MIVEELAICGKEVKAGMKINDYDMQRWSWSRTIRSRS